jgi:glycosyltransferase involved in cell wall biosynthesis
MRILIIDMGKYFPDGDNYNEVFHIYEILTKHGYQTDLYKYTYYDKPETIHPINLETMLSRKYDIIISMGPQNSDYIYNYIKRTKLSPIIIFFDRYDYLKMLTSKPKFFEFKKKEFIKKTAKILPYIYLYLTNDEYTLHAVTGLIGINAEYIPPYINPKHFTYDKDLLKDDKNKPVLFINRLNYKQNAIETLIQAVKYITKTDFLETHNLLIDISKDGDDVEKFVKDITHEKLTEYFRLVPHIPYNIFPEYVRNHRFAITVPKDYSDVKSTIISMANGLPVLIDSRFNKNADPYEVSWADNNIIFARKDMRSIIKDTHNGIVFESGNYVDLAEKLMLMIDSDLTYMKRKAFETAMKFKTEFYDNKLLEIIDKIKEENKKQMLSEI